MVFTSSIIEISVCLFLGMLAFMELGRRIGLGRISSDPEGFSKGVGAIEATTFALLGLLIAFAFSGAASRLDTRRHLMVEEANAIATAYVRAKMLPQEAQQRLGERFRRYVDIRLELSRNFSDPLTYGKDRAMMATVQSEIWNEAVSACKNQDSQATTMLLLPAINRMIDMSTARASDTRMRPPETIFLMLGVLAIISSMVAGYRMAGQKKRSWLHTLGYCAIVALAVYVILDLEQPRLGLTQTDQAEQVLLELRQSFR